MIRIFILVFLIGLALIKKQNLFQFDNELYVVNQIANPLNDKKDIVIIDQK